MMLVLDHGRLAEARVAAGLSLREAARRLNVSKTTVVNAEQGHTSPSADLLGAMAALYGVSVDEFYRHGTDASRSAKSAPEDHPGRTAAGTRSATGADR
jgi:transcriptional regulator with XRE-family HTH domain